MRDRASPLKVVRTPELFVDETALQGPRLRAHSILMPNDVLFQGVTAKRHRLYKGLTRGELGAKVGSSRDSIRRIEEGLFQPKPRVALAIARELELPIQALYTPEDSEAVAS